jgi:hypothetical protein
MAVCEVCGNDYDKPLIITKDKDEHTFDSFECAVHALAPICAHCHCRVLGHGIEARGMMFCCAHCARHGGVEAVRDRV